MVYMRNQNGWQARLKLPVMTRTLAKVEKILSGGIRVCAHHLQNRSPYGGFSCCLSGTPVVTIICNK